MKVTILKPYGYCAGVERAIKLALKTKETNPRNNVVVLGMLIHNEDALKTLKKAKIKTIFKENSSLEELAVSIKKPSIVILTAHGHTKEVENILLKNGHKIVDATCPFVEKTENIIRDEINKNKTVFYIGVSNHPETNASLSISKFVKLVDINNIKIPRVKDKSPLVIAQTTLSNDIVDNVYSMIKKSYPKARLVSGICNSSTDRQNALKTLKNDVDGILIVGDDKSNNTKTLYKLAKSLHPHIYVDMVRNYKDINKKDLNGLNHIVISSGASTPKHIIEEIKDKLSD